MKINISIFLFLLSVWVSGKVQAQQNYIQVFTYKKPSANLEENSIQATVKGIQFFDGLGRKSVSVERGATPGMQDLLSGHTYDEAGREQKVSLPVVYQLEDQSITVDEVFQLASTQYGDTHAFHENVYEPSPLGWLSKQYGAGDEWYNQDKAVNYIYHTNQKTGVLYCPMYRINGQQVVASLSKYAVGSLSVVEHTDEDGRKSYTFTDKAGKMIMVRQIDNGTYHDTRYVYDEFGNRRFVLPPQMKDLSVKSHDEFAYSYQYDALNRCVIKKLPGCQPVYMVYDRSGRVVMQQDGNQRTQNKWLFSTYDRLGRLLYTSEVTDAASLTVMIQRFKEEVVTATFSTASQTSGIEDTGYSGARYNDSSSALLTVNYYDTYDFLNLEAYRDKGTEFLYKETEYGTNYGNACGLLTGTRTYNLGNPAIYSFDADGKLVIFINGMHTGDGGSPRYWSMYNHGKVDFDIAVMAHFKDFSPNTMYLDGSVGGIYATLGSAKYFATGNLNPMYRYSEGYAYGEAEAFNIISKLGRDSEGYITESIRVITHSMGAAYAKGLVTAIVKFAENNPDYCKGLKIAEYDFAPFQPLYQRAVKGVPTFQYSHSGDYIAGKVSISGAIYMNASSDKDQNHYLWMFYEQINKLPEGTYTFIDGKIVDISKKDK